jgi:type I restriction enzyme S subunit
MKLKPYSVYKDTDVEWLVEIPEHWNTQRLKFNSYIKGRIGWQNLRSDEFINEGPYLVTGMHFKEGGVNWDACYHINEDRYQMAPEIFVREGDVLITKDGSIGKLAYISYLPGKASLNSHLLIIRPLRDSYHSKFLYYLLGSEIFQKFVLIEQKGTTFYGITQESIENFPALIPSFAEQRAIAVFLDREIEHIDALIAKKEQQIELLQEKRNALISHVVTKGIDPNAKMKDSGIEWLGEIPKHWDVKKLKYLAHFKSGDNIISTDIDETGDYPVFGGNGLRGYTSSYNHEGDYVLIGRQGALCGNINYASGRFWASEHAVVATLISGNHIYWCGELLRVMNLNQYSQSAAQPGLAVEQIKHLLVPVPPKDEQKAIGFFLKRKIRSIDALATRIRESIRKLSEYRAALISAAVTGKIDVRKEAA